MSKASKISREAVEVNLVGVKLSSGDREGRLMQELSLCACDSIPVYGCSQTW